MILGRGERSLAQPEHAPSNGVEAGRRSRREDVADEVPVERHAVARLGRRDEGAGRRRATHRASAPARRDELAVLPEQRRARTSALSPSPATTRAAVVRHWSRMWSGSSTMPARGAGRATGRPRRRGSSGAGRRRRRRRRRRARAARPSRPRKRSSTWRASRRRAARGRGARCRPSTPRRRAGRAGRRCRSRPRSARGTARRRRTCARAPRGRRRTPRRRRTRAACRGLSAPQRPSAFGGYA